jgi:hypothetical protein
MCVRVLWELEKRIIDKQSLTETFTTSDGAKMRKTYPRNLSAASPV